MIAFFLLAAAIANVHGMQSPAAMEGMRADVGLSRHKHKHTSWTSPSGFFIQVRPPRAQCDALGSSCRQIKRLI